MEVQCQNVIYCMNQKFCRMTSFPFYIPGNLNWVYNAPTLIILPE